MTSPGTLSGQEFVGIPQGETLKEKCRKDKKSWDSEIFLKLITLPVQNSTSPILEGDDSNWGTVCIGIT